MAKCAPGGFVSAVVLLWTISHAEATSSLGQLSSSVPGIRGEVFLFDDEMVVVKNFFHDEKLKCSTFMIGVDKNDIGRVLPYEIESSSEILMPKRVKRYLVPKITALDPSFHPLDWAFVEREEFPRPHPFGHEDIANLLHSKVAYNLENAKRDQGSFVSEELSNGQKLKMRGFQNEVTVFSSGVERKVKARPTFLTNKNSKHEIPEVTIFGGKSNSQVPYPTITTPATPKPFTVTPSSSSQVFDTIKQHNIIKPMRGKTVVIYLPNMQSSWLSIYDHCRKVTLARKNLAPAVNAKGSSVKLENGTELNGLHIGEVYVVNCKTLLLSDVRYEPKPNEQIFFFGSADDVPRYKFDLIASDNKERSAALGQQQASDLLLEVPQGVSLASVNWLHLFDPRSGKLHGSFKIAERQKSHCLF